MRALITGITGQDGAHLAHLLLNKGYDVIGVVRRTSSNNMYRIKNLNIRIVYGDVTDSTFMMSLIRETTPDEVYNLAAQSDVAVSFSNPSYTIDTIYKGTLNILEACKHTNIKVYQASSSEMFGGTIDTAYDEESAMIPQSPYASAKLMAHELCRIYRDSYGMFVCCGILFNHTSIFRGEDFVEKKIIRNAVEIIHGKREKLFLGNIYTKRDFGHSKDYVLAMHMMLQHNIPNDYVVATGSAIRIKDLVNLVFDTLDAKLTWSGEGLNERACLGNKIVVEIDEKLYRPLEVNCLIGNSDKIRQIISWYPSYDFDKIIKEMIDYEISLLAK